MDYDAIRCSAVLKGVLDHLASHHSQPGHGGCLPDTVPALALSLAA